MFSVVAISLTVGSYSAGESDGDVSVCVEVDGDVRLGDGVVFEVQLTTADGEAQENGKKI